MRFRVTETRTIVIDLDRYQRMVGEEDEDAVEDVARSLPVTEWDTLDRQVEPL